MKTSSLAILIQLLLCCAVAFAQNESTTVEPTTTSGANKVTTETPQTTKGANIVSTTDKSPASSGTKGDSNANNGTTVTPSSNCTTTTEPEETCAKKGAYCMDNEQCCEGLVCNFLTCAKCVTARHYCEDDADCCKGLKCVQIAPVNNNDFFGQFFPIANKFNPSRQCTRVAKTKKPSGSGPGGFGAGGFDWSHFIPFKGMPTGGKAKQTV